ncbi:DnaJ domain containing protein [Quillaja saponaria]|uniref:DnaJ domain containing protein n=1 Tax=Quillaja saponaria TaxID=32244 RepID=A0AAD7L9X2_QUISA|nr:DnaJ domain containing protein [Quillaja saponaria]
MDIEMENSRKLNRVKSTINEKHRASKKIGGLEVEEYTGSSEEDLEIMLWWIKISMILTKIDRVERSFKKGQVWAIYDDDDDGIPRHYGLIDEAVSVNSFEVKISWLDLQNNGDEGKICWEKMAFH